MKHTPGPWLSACNHRWGHQVVARAAGGGTVTIAHLGNLEFDEDNARLIAAAPDLLHVALMVLRGASDGALYGFARAAVDKVTGDGP